MALTVDAASVGTPTELFRAPGIEKATVGAALTKSVVVTVRDGTPTDIESFTWL